MRNPFLRLLGLPLLSALIPWPDVSAQQPAFVTFSVRGTGEDSIAFARLSVRVGAALMNEQVR